jgi:uncharacterized membrane protein
MTKTQFYLTKTASMLWIRPTILSLTAIGWVGLSYFADSLLPMAWKVNIEKSTLINLFSILASTMLTVATFSVSAVATAFGSVATSASPRATAIVMSDSGIQSTLAAFLGSFIYAVVSITALSALNFGAPGRFMLFLGFVLLVGWVLMSFVRWVDRVSRLGKLADTLQRLTVAARAAFAEPETAGLLGGRGLEERARPEQATVLHADRFGYVQYLDMEKLQTIAEELDGEIWLEVRPGSLLTKNAPIGSLQFAKTPEEADLKRVLKCISAGHNRDYKTDPRFALILFAEVADRALSPAVNDPGTAINVISIQLELFHTWAENARSKSEPDGPKFSRIFVPEITAEDLLADAFTGIARDGAGMIEVGLRLQKALRALTLMNDDRLTAAALAFRETALELSDRALPVESQRAAVRRVARQTS